MYSWIYLRPSERLVKEFKPGQVLGYYIQGKKIIQYFLEQ